MGSIHLFPSPPPGNEHNNFRINPSTGLVMRGMRHLDREQNSSHVLEVEAYNTEQGPMRSSVRVRTPRPPRGGRQGWARAKYSGCFIAEQLFPALAKACRMFERSGMEMLMESLRGLPVGGEELVGVFFFVGFGLGFFYFPVTFRCDEAAKRCGSRCQREVGSPGEMRLCCWEEELSPSLLETGSPGQAPI